MIRLFNCDNLDFMRSVPDGFYELALVDPPYGIERGETFGGKNWKDYPKKQWDNLPPSSEYFKELFRVSKNQIIWGANYFPYELDASMGWVFWDKGQDLTMSDGELAFTSFQRALRRVEINRCHNSEFGGLLHPTQKPVRLYKWLLKNYAKEGDKIFDSHGGSLSIAIACGEMGYSLDACELDGDYFKESVARVQRHFTQSNAFMKTPEILVNP